MLDKLKIKTKLLIVFLLIGLVPLAMVTFMAINKSATALHDEVWAKFEALQMAKRHHLEDYFRQLQATLKLARNDPYLHNALMVFDSAYKSSGNSIDSDEWRKQARLCDPHIKDIVADNGWYDLLLIDPDGDIVYTAAKEPDLGQSIAKGNLRDSGLGKAYRVIQSAPDNAVISADFEPYAPSNGVQAGFMVAKMKSPNGQVMGFIALQIPTDRVNAIAQQRDGLGRTGESYLVGRLGDKAFLRSDRVIKTGKIGDAKSDNYIEKALKGESGAAVKTGSTGEKEFVRYDPVQVEGLNWGMITTSAVDEMLAAVSTLRNAILVLIAVVAGVIIGVALWFTGKIARPIKGTAEMLKDIAQGEGDLTRRLVIATQDEIGEMGRWFNLFMEKLQALIKEITQNAGTLHDSSTSLSAIAAQLSGSADAMSKRSDGVAAAAEEMSANMNSVAAASEQAATNVNMVASASEEMTSTVQEIARNSEKARTITEVAVTQAGGASAKVGELGCAANEISKVTEAITEISEQTNLLALNATIEAARAGEAGKGFAVVANEIKELAKQTAQATQEIKSRIKGIQDSTAGTVTQIEQITTVINDVNEIVGTIATAVEEQAVTSQEIAGNVTQASQGIQEVNENVSQSSTAAGTISGDIAAVNQSVQEISNSSGQVNLNAEELSKLAGRLQELVGRFKV